jgi:uncharacterized protein YhaN
MKVERASVGSYGTLHDKDIRFGDLTVVEGPNEAGKSTLRSFIADCLFEKNPMKYPGKKSSDNGKLYVTMSDGTQRVIERDGKKSVGTLDEECGISGKDFQAIYCLDTESLRDDRPLLDGGVRDRFLTVPGGSALPEARADLEKERTSYVPDLKRSRNSKIAILEDELADRTREVEELKASADGDNAYNSMVAKKKDLEARIAEAKKEAEAEKEAANKAAVESSKAESRKKLAELRNREKELSYAEVCRGKDDGVLKSDLERAQNEKKEAEQNYSQCKLDMGRANPDAVLARERDIESLRYMRPEPERPAPKAKASVNSFVILGVILVIAGIALAAVSSVWLAAVAVVGIALIYYGWKNKPAAPVEAPKKSSDPLLDSVAADVGIFRTSDREADIRRLNDLVPKARACRAAKDRLDRAQEVLSKAEHEAELFYSGFGGEEGYAKARNDLAELDAVRQQAAGLEAAVGAEPAPSEEPQVQVTGDAEQRLNDLVFEHGQTVQALKAIESDTRTEDAITARSEAENRLYEAVRRWGVLRLEQEILDRATERMYSEHRPEVLSEADRLLSLMTGGRYRLRGAVDGDLVIEDVNTGEAKGSSQWSSGLGDQVLLSLKAAVALSMCKEHPPLLLDDVMITFDPERRQGACKALASLAGRIQVVYFTCDPETAQELVSVGAERVSL